MQDGSDIPIGSGPSESKDTGRDVMQLLKQKTVSVGPSKGLAGENTHQLEDTKEMTALVETDGKTKKNENSEAGPNVMRMTLICPQFNSNDYFLHVSLPCFFTVKHRDSQLCRFRQTSEQRCDHLSGCHEEARHYVFLLLNL